MLVVILCLCTSVDYVVTITRVKLLFTIHHQNVRLETDVVCYSFPCELVGELILVYHSNSYSVAYEERFVVIHVPCLTSTTVMLLVNSNSIFIPHERNNSTQDFTTAHARLVTTLELRHSCIIPRPLPRYPRNLSVTLSQTRPLSHFKALHATSVTLE